VKKKSKIIMTRKKKSQRPKDREPSSKVGSVVIGDNDYSALEGLIKDINVAMKSKGIK
jgi:hypothetical protein